MKCVGRKDLRLLEWRYFGLNALFGRSFDCLNGMEFRVQCLGRRELRLLE